MRINISGYIEAVLFAVVFLLFISGEAGWLMIYIVTAESVLSVVTCAVSRKRFTAETTGFSGVCRTGDRVTAEMTFTKKGFCFLPFITVSGEFMGSPFTARASLLFRNSASVKINMRAVKCGLNRLSVESLTVRDFMGIVTLPVKQELDGCAAAVLPRLVDYKGPMVIPSLLPAGDEEESEEGASVLFGGMAGYEHREYVPGDSPRRVNYKLSAKKGSLMIRLDENTAVEAVEIMMSRDADSGCAEQALALAMNLISQGGSAKVCFDSESFTANSPATADRLREWLAFRELDGSGTSGETPPPEPGRNAVVISPKGILVN